MRLETRSLYNRSGYFRNLVKWQYKLPYNSIFGGVVAINTNQFRKLNGFSNSFWGWGGEDDDMAARIRLVKLKVERYSSKVARYTMIRHGQEEANADRMKILSTSKARLRTDGIRDLNYTVISRERERLYTNISSLLVQNVPARTNSTKPALVPANMTSASSVTVMETEVVEKMPNLGN